MTERKHAKNNKGHKKEKKGHSNLVWPALKLEITNQTYVLADELSAVLKEIKEQKRGLQYKPVSPA